MTRLLTLTNMHVITSQIIQSSNFNLFSGLKLLRCVLLLAHYLSKMWSVDNILHSFGDEEAQQL